MGQLNEDRILVWQALEDGKLTVHLFSFDRFSTCDKKHCNRCSQLYGMTNISLDKNRFICRALPSVRKPEDSLDLFYLFNKIRDEKLSSHNTTFHLRNQDGIYEMYEISGKSMDIDESGAPYVIIGSIIEKGNDELVIADHQKSKDLSLLKSTFLANTTHEIRTPLNAIVGFSGMPGLEDDPEAREQYTSMTKKNNTVLFELINDTFEMPRIESNTINRSHEDVNPLTIIHDVYECASPHISKSVRLILDDSPNVSLHTDKHKLMPILKKLLSNTPRYTEKGEIHFGYQSLYPVSVQFYVSDTGNGVPKDKPGHILGRLV